jgi:NAD(P)H-binding
MKLTIFGATGATGTCLAEQAIAAGHDVTAVVRDPARLTVPGHQRLTVVTANVMEPDSISPAMTGADAVLTALGPHGEQGQVTVTAATCSSRRYAEGTSRRTGTSRTRRSVLRSIPTKVKIVGGARRAREMMSEAMPPRGPGNAADRRDSTVLGARMGANVHRSQAVRGIPGDCRCRSDPFPAAAGNVAPGRACLAARWPGIWRRRWRHSGPGRRTPDRHVRRGGRAGAEGPRVRPDRERARPGATGVNAERNWRSWACTCPPARTAPDGPRSSAT